MKSFKKKIFFLGTPEIANPSLETIAKLNEYEIVGVGVFPDRKVGRKQILTPCAVKQKAIKLNIPLFEIESKESLVEITQTLDFDLGIVIAFGMIFPESILNINYSNIQTQNTTNLKNFINIHFSLLPLYRGASPVQSAILNGDRKSGITWQLMTKELDAGDILFQKEYNIQGKKTSELWNYFAIETAKYFPEFLNKYFDHRIIREKQKNKSATFCGKFSKSDGAVNFQSMTAQEIDQKFRAFDVWPGIYVDTEKGNIKIEECTLSKNEKTAEIECKNSTKLYLKKIKIPGKKVGNAIDILKGNPSLF